MKMVVEFGDDFSGLESTAINRQTLDELGKQVQQRQVFVDGRQHAGAKHLDGDLSPIKQPGEMNLGDRCAGNRLVIEL